ncbi:MAG TPA: helix-turn-helix transcriptional regulator, partial [Pseudorhodoferax sp.]|nr:helix-turn-helix transcriptional regulator [Pseudorhodoferax sp.]
DLTPAEARVAVQVAAGASLKEIAQRHGTALATVRTQLHSVMAKVEVERQADLVRALLALPVRGAQASTP